MLKYRFNDGSVRSYSKMQTVNINDLDRVIQIFESHVDAMSDIYSPKVPIELILMYKLITDPKAKNIKEKYIYADNNEEVPTFNYSGYNLPRLIINIVDPELPEGFGIIFF